MVRAHAPHPSRSILPIAPSRNWGDPVLENPARYPTFRINRAIPQLCQANWVTT
jgi:hypothetical protein